MDKIKARNMKARAKEVENGKAYREWKKTVKNHEND